MSKLMVLSVVLASVFSAAAAFSQDLSVQVSPSPALRGTPIQLDIQNRGTGPVYFPDSCIIRAVTAGSPGGRIVWAPEICADVVIPLDEGGALSATWSAQTLDGSYATPGDYWLHVEVIEGGILKTKSYAARVVGSSLSQPELIQFSNSGIGQSVALGLLAPDHRGGVYAVAASLSMDEGMPLSIGHLALDADPVFELSFPDPHPSFFQGFQGSISETGEALAISVLVPADPRLAGITVYLQSLAVPQSMELSRARLSNVVSMQL